MKVGWTGKGTLRGTGGIVTLGGTGGIVDLRGTGGIFTLVCTGGIVTLGRNWGIVTLGGGGGTVRTAGYGETIMGRAGFAMALSDILARSTMAFCWGLPNWENGAAGAGLARASIRAHDVTMAASTEEVFGTGHWCRKNCTVLAVSLALVLGIYSRYQQ